MDPSSPGPSEDFSQKEPAHLGEPITLAVSLSSPGRAAMVPDATFSINRREGELRKGFQHRALREIERNKGEEDKRRENEAKALPNCDCDQPLHRSLFGVLYATII